MKLKARLDQSAFDSLESVDLKTLYAKDEKNNDYILDMDGSEAAVLATGLNTELEKLRKHNTTLLNEKKEVQDKLKPYEDLGKTVQEIEAVINDKTPQDVVELTKTHKLELESVRTSTQDEVNKEKERAADLERQLLSSLKNSAIDKAIRDNTATPLAYDYLDRRVIVEKNDIGEYVVKVLDDKQEVAYKGGQPMTPTQLLEDKKTDPVYSGMFFAGEGGGTGVRPTGSGISTNGVINANDLGAFQDNLDKIVAGEAKVVGLPG